MDGNILQVMCNKIPKLTVKEAEIKIQKCLINLTKHPGSFNSWSDQLIPKVLTPTINKPSIHQQQPKDYHTLFLSQLVSLYPEIITV